MSATSADDPQAAPLAIDSSASTFWHTSYYLDSPYFGNLKKGTGLVLDMGKPVKISQVRVKFGSTPGANVQIKVGNSALPPDPAAAGPLPTVAQANGIGGSYTFTMKQAGPRTVRRHLAHQAAAADRDGQPVPGQHLQRHHPGHGLNLGPASSGGRPDAELLRFTSPATPTRSASCSAVIATGSGRWRCARCTTRMTPRTRCRRR